MVADMVSKWRTSKRLDLLLGALCGVGAWWLVDLAPDGATLYQVTGGSAIGLLAFVVTPVATILTLRGGRRSDAMDRHHRPTMVAAMSWAFVLNILLLLVSIAGSAIDNPHDPVRIVRFGLLGTAVASVLAVGRLFWFFVALLAVRQADETDPIERASAR